MQSSGSSGVTGAFALWTLGHKTGTARSCPILENTFLPHGITELLRLENPSELPEANRSPSTAKATNEPRPHAPQPARPLNPGRDSHSPSLEQSFPLVQSPPSLPFPPGEFPCARGSYSVPGAPAPCQPQSQRSCGSVLPVPALCREQEPRIPAEPAVAARCHLQLCDHTRTDLPSAPSRRPEALPGDTGHSTRGTRSIAHGGGTQNTAHGGHKAQDTGDTEHRTRWGTPGTEHRILTRITPGAPRARTANISP